jgi:hypothetical protein
MGNDQYRATPADRAHIGLNDPLAFIIKRRSSFIENQDPRIGHQRTRYGNTLPLAAEMIGAVLLENVIVPVRKLEDELMGPSQLSRGNDLLQRHCGVGQGDVVAWNG